MTILFGLLFWLMLGVMSATIAKSRGRSSLGWFLMGILLGPIGILVTLLPPKEKFGVTKKCPDCAEIIKMEANVCKHCGRKFK